VADIRSDSSSIKNYHLRRVIAHRPDAFNAVAWSPDGKSLASGSYDKTVRVWNAATGNLLRTLEGHSSAVRSVAWSPNGKSLASGSGDNTVRVWNAESGKLLRTLEGHSSDVQSVAWSPDGKSLASGSGDNTVRVWNAESGKLLRTLEGHAEWVQSVAWSPDGKSLASGSDDNTVRVWNAESGKLLRTFEGHSRWVRSVAWSLDGKSLASGSGDKTVRVWNAESGKILRTLEGHSSAVLSVAWSPDGNSLASGSYDKTVRVWNTESGKLLRTLKGHAHFVRSVAWSPDGKSLASGSYDRTVRVWNAKSGKILRTLEGHSSAVLSVAWSPDGKSLASGCDDKTVRVWNAESGKLLRTLEGHADFVRSVAWSPDGKSLASGSHDNTVRLWDAATGNLLRTLEGHSSAVQSVAWSPEGKSLASGSGDKTVRVWNAESGKLLLTLEGHARSVLSVDWSPEGKSLASGSDDKTVRVWNAKSGKLLRTLEGHADFVRSVAWSPDGTSLASGSHDKTVRVWNAESGKLARALEGHGRLVRSVAWSPDGKSLASGSDDKTVHIWDTAKWEVSVYFPLGHPSHSLLDLAFAASAHGARTFGTTLLGDPDIITLTLNISSTVSPQRESNVSIASAKIVLVGESNVGKSCLALQLAKDRYEEQGTTHGMQLWKLDPNRFGATRDTSNGEKREVVLWDLGGQPEYRLVNQLFLHETNLALMLLDPTRGSSAFEDVREWNLRLEKQMGGQHASKLLVGTKLDDENMLVDNSALEQLENNCETKGYIPTSAKAPRGIEELREAIGRELKWDEISRTTRPVVYQRVRDVIDAWQQRSAFLISHSDLEKEVRAQSPSDYDPNIIEQVVEQLRAQGVVAESQLGTGERVLVLQIGYVAQYAGSIILAAKANPRGVPAVEEAEVVSGRIALPRMKPEDRLPAQQEVVALNCVVHLLVSHGLCLRHEGMLVFPSEFPLLVDNNHDGLGHTISLYYDFSGAIENIYAPLVVRLALSERFGRVRLAKDRAEYEAPGKGICGLRKRDRKSGLAHLDLYFSDEVSTDRRNLFTVVVEDYLSTNGVAIKEILGITCPCSYQFDETLVRERIDLEHKDVICPRCEQRSPISEGAKKARETSPEIQQELFALKGGYELRDLERTGTAEVSITRLPVHAVKSRTDDSRIRILHLSDLHFSSDTDPVLMWQPLLADIRDAEGGLGFQQVDYLVVSGDLTNRADPREFERAREFISALIERLGVSALRCIIVPGNHDLSYDVEAYGWKQKRRVNPKELVDGHYVAQGEGYLIRQQTNYPARFENFGKFYHALTQEPYTLDASAQHLSFLAENARIQFLALNSAWEIDEYFKNRSSISATALSAGMIKADDQIERAKKAGSLKADDPVLRIAVWHHPITGNDKIEVDAFVERLRQAEFKLCLHGHVHEERAELIGYLDPSRKLRVAGAGSFGAPTNARPESTPRLYNLLEIERDHSRIRVHTRCMRKSDGAWEGWAVWPGSIGTERRTYYEIDLTR
jgi:small GTP-binding protein